MSKGKIAVVIAILLVVGLLIYIGPEKYLNLEYIKSRLGQLIAFREEKPLLTGLIFSSIYIAVTAASIPGALVLTLCSGAIFGFIWGSIIALVSATIGATIAFLVARYLFDDWVQAKMGQRVAKIRENFRAEGALYLFSMRLVPVIPFFAINLLMGLTSIKTVTYFFASLLGMAPGSMVFVNAGTQLAKIDSLKGLLSPGLIASFVLLAIFPYLAKYVLTLIKNKAIKNRAS
ncbi:TVP38/TMEM64 family protein [Candidatus Spongiihabitans sp.]|uniref:TVP38/TMEM64 family protein n=1 Tax=Candidatus Spongiihabitans sp. TaxID=3101308 RepID=UPI003C70045A